MGTNEVEKNYRKVYIDALITQGVLIVLYLITLYRLIFRDRLNFLIMLTGLLLCSCVTWILYCKLKLSFAQSNSTLDCDSPCKTSNNNECFDGTQCFYQASVLFLNDVSFNFALFFFVLKYWNLSIYLKQSYALKLKDDIDRKTKILMWIGLTLIVVVEAI